MPPRNANDVAFVTSEDDDLQLVSDVTTPDADKRRATEVVWLNVVRIGALHAIAVFGIFLLPKLHVATWIWSE